MLGSKSLLYVISYNKSTKYLDGVNICAFGLGSYMASGELQYGTYNGNDFECELSHIISDSLSTSTCLLRFCSMYVISFNVTDSELSDFPNVIPTSEKLAQMKANDSRQVAKARYCHNPPSVNSVEFSSDRLFSSTCF